VKLHSREKSLNLHVSQRIHFSGEMRLKVNRYNRSLCNNAQKPSNQVDSFRKCVQYAIAFAKYAGEHLIGNRFGMLRYRETNYAGTACSARRKQRNDRAW